MSTLTHGYRFLVVKVQDGYTILDTARGGPPSTSHLFTSDAFVAYDACAILNRELGAVNIPAQPTLTNRHEPDRPRGKWITCDCSWATDCPQGKVGCESRCRIWTRSAPEQT